MDIGLGVTGNPGDKERLGAQYHLPNATITWMDFSSTDGKVATMLLRLVAVLAPLSSPFFVGSTVRSLSRGKEFSYVEIVGPTFAIAFPLIVGFVLFFLLEVVGQFSWRKWGRRIEEPPLQERKKYVTSIIDTTLRKQNFEGLTPHNFKARYGNTVAGAVGLVILIVVAVWVEMDSETIPMMIITQIIAIALSFCVFVILFMIPRYVILYRLEREYTQELQGANTTMVSEK